MNSLNIKIIIIATFYIFNFLHGERAYPTFVSLGSNCIVSENLRHNFLRTEAYPFDWLLTLKEESIITAINDDFAFFMDENYLKPNPLYIRNTYYHIDFWHDWPSNEFEAYLQTNKQKYARRIERFLALANHREKVYFIRGAYNCPHARTTNNSTKEVNAYNCAVLSKEQHTELVEDSVGCRHVNIDLPQAKNIKHALDQKFPNLDFSLIIINFVDDLEPNVETINEKNIKEFRIRNDYIIEDFKKILKSLNKKQKIKSVRNI